MSNMISETSPFLTARWTHLAMLNYEIDPQILQPFVPAGTELDSWQGQTLASIVGFLFLETRLLGLPVPGHRNFEELNLRFYVRRRGPEGWRRGVVFIKEIVPRRAIAWLARAAYGENYVRLPMSHQISTANGILQAVSYSWRAAGRENKLRLEVAGPPTIPATGSAAEFITEHYWGYARRRNGRTVEYRVTHPQWAVQTAAKSEFDCDVSSLYGDQFAPFLQDPVSAFLAAGSEVTVYKGRLLSSVD